MNNLVLGIETSCDDTCISVVKDGHVVLANEVSSQAEMHARYGGIVPELASRSHSSSFIPMLELTLQKAEVELEELGLIAVTRGPGLIGSLLVGMMAAKGLAWSLNLPLVGVNHLWAHIWASSLGEREGQVPRPAVCLVVSGGHTELVYLREGESFEGDLLGQTRDDAAGEAFDKVARIMGLDYPGGPIIDKLAEKYEGEFFNLPRPMLEHDSGDLSFSGLKTAVVRLIEKISGMELTMDSIPLSDTDRMKVAASFQQAVVEVLAHKCMWGLKSTGAETLIVVGGVAANRQLRSCLKDLCKRHSIRLIIPEINYCTDNAAMVAAAGYSQFNRFGPDSLHIDVNPSLNLPG